MGLEEYGNPNLVVMTRMMVIIVVMYNVEITLFGFLITMTNGHKKLRKNKRYSLNVLDG